MVFFLFTKQKESSLINITKLTEKHRQHIGNFHIKEAVWNVKTISYYRKCLADLYLFGCTSKAF